jgi:NADH-quinone oxidoreductase subunit F
VDVPAQGSSRADLLLLNADESEPGTFNNRILMEDDPHQVIEGMIISCYATRATDGVHLHALRVPAGLPAAAAAIDECYAAGYLGKNILGSGFSLDIYLHRGRGGLHLRRRDRADRKPGRQAGLAADQAAVSRVEGVFRKPTVVNNVETVACVTHIIERGVDWFKSIGVPPIRTTRATRQLRAQAVLPERPCRTSPAATKRRWASPAAS